MPRSFVPASLLALALAAAGCGTDDEGSVATLRLQDAPPTGVTSVKVKVASMQVHVAKSDDKKTESDPNDTTVDDSDRWVSLAVNKTIDLVAHQGEGAAETLGDLDLPAGKITQIRLELDTGEAANNTIDSDTGTCNLNVEKVAKKGIKINHVFKAFQSKKNEKLDVYVDFDLEKSLKKADKNGDCWKLEPVLKLHKVKRGGKDEDTTAK